MIEVTSIRTVWSLSSGPFAISLNLLIDMRSKTEKLIEPRNANIEIITLIARL